MVRQRHWLILIACIFLIGIAHPALAEGASPSDEVVQRCIGAMGGQERFDALRTLRLTMYWPGHGMLYADYERPNRCSLGQHREVVWDGDRAAMMSVDVNGSRSCRMPVPEGDLVDFEVEMGWYVPAFLDYPASHVGSATLDNGEMEVLEVTLPRGGVLTYYINAETNLIDTVKATFVMYDKEYQSERSFGDYRERGGILYPFSFTHTSMDGNRVDVLLLSLSLDVEFPEGHFDTSACFPDAPE